MDTRHIAALLTGLVLVASSVGGFTLRPAEAVPLASLPPDTQRTVGLILMGLSPYVQQLSVIAIQALPPDRAQVMVNNFRGLRSYPDAQIVQVAQQVDGAIKFVLRTLPQSDHRRYINGVWGVSSADEQFAQTAEQRAVQILRASGGGVAPGAPGVGGGIDPLQYQQAQHDLQCTWLPTLPSCRR